MGLSRPEFPIRQRPRQREGFTGAGFEPGANRDVILLDGIHVFGQEPHHAFPFTIRSLGIVPEPWEVTGKGGDSGTLPSLFYPE